MTKKEESTKLNCGIVMPISNHQDYPDNHWKDVLNIIVAAVNETEFEPSLVSDDAAIGLIHDRIVSNLYANEIVVCDVSSKNPNVMFELGMRLAFDKPTIIIKDELTGFSFDTGIIEHLQYPSTLRFSEIVDFKQELIKKIEATYDKSQTDPSYSPFLKNFGQKIIAGTINSKEISESNYIIESLNDLKEEVRYLRGSQFSQKAKFESRRGFSSRNYLNAKNFIFSHLDSLKMKFSTIYNLREVIDNENHKQGIKLTIDEVYDLADEYRLARNLKLVDHG